MTEGLTFPVQVLRVTQIIGAMSRDEAVLGRTLTRSRFSMKITPVIETGERFGGYRRPDRFDHFEFEMHHRGWRRWIPLPDTELLDLLDHHCAIELWTSNDPTVPDPGHPWIHWLFPSTSWLRKGRGWTGRSYAEAPKIIPNDFPEPVALTEGGFWKTATPPPVIERSFP